MTGMAAVAIDAVRAADLAQRGPVPVPVRTAGPAADRSLTGARPGRSVRSWPLLVLAVPAAAEVWSGWVGIAQKTGFGLVSPLPGIWPSLHLDTAITLPVGVEAYAAYALGAWLARDPAISARTRRFAKWSAIFSFALGMAGQVAYHLLAQAGMARAPWAITTVVSCLPVLVLGMGTALAHMLRADAGAAGNGTGPPAALRSLAWSSGSEPGQTADHQKRTGTGPPGPDQHVPAPGPQHSRPVARTWPPARAAPAGRGPHRRARASRGRETRITASIAQRRSQRLQRSTERPRVHDHRRASQCVSGP